jgi:16S rRNA (guanine527-N7)-methyltransferase
MNDILLQGLETLKLEDPATAALLTLYIEEIERFNPAYGLVGTRDRRELVVKHILDSLSPLGRLIQLMGPDAVPPLIADVGSGAGLPGIPLAIALPKVRFSLIERMGRRAAFLRNTLAVLGLTNVTVEECEMEKAAPSRFDMAVFRAFRPLEKPVLKSLLRLLKEGGCLAAYKGRRDVVEAEMRAAGLPAAAWETFPCPVPFLDDERRLLVIPQQSPLM